jgi:4-amino-4-deoxy-L-arabinose transferase-like glycosyltransferase
MVEFIRSRWVLIAVLTLFVLFKVPHLLLPFYWDESWPYVPAVREMYRNGISLLPSAINPDLSRGHPLFFHSIYAIWMHIFGSSNKALHSFALFISLVFLVTIFEVGSRLFNQRVAIMSLLLVATHVSFFIQSSFVLPELLVAFLVFLSIYLYVKERFFLATLSLTALFFTKESGLIAGFVIGSDAIISFFNKDIELKKRILRLLPVTTGCIAIASFFILQKQIRGWYFFPLHSNSILLKWDAIWSRFGTGVVHAVFCQDYEGIIFVTMVVLLIIKNKLTNVMAPLSLSILIIIGYYTETSRIIELWGKGPLLYAYTYAIFFAFIFLYLYVLFYFSRKQFYTNDTQRRFVILTGIFIFCLILFSSDVYFISRYVLAAGIATLFLVAVFYDILISRSYKVLYYPLIMIILFTAYLSFKYNEGWGDEKIKFTQGLKTEAAIVEFMERSNFYDRYIYTNSFLDYKHLTDPNTGFLSSEKKFKNVEQGIDSLTEFLVYDNTEDIGVMPGVMKNNTAFELIYRIAYGDKWAEIYRKK